MACDYSKENKVSIWWEEQSLASPIEIKTICESKKALQRIPAGTHEHN